MRRDHFPPKSPIIGGVFAKRNLQLKAIYASSPICTTQLHMHPLSLRVVFLQRGKRLRGINIEGQQRKRDCARECAKEIQRLREREREEKCEREKKCERESVCVRLHVCTLCVCVCFHVYMNVHG